MLSRVKETIKKKEKVLVLILIIIAVSAFSFNVRLDASDELWNFSNVYKMTNGYTIYKDLNVIITPLFFYLGQLIFKIFDSNFLSFRIWNVVIYTIFYMTVYLIYKELKMKSKRLYFYLIFVYILTFELISGSANYNILALELYLIGILLILKNKPNWLQGIIIFLIFMTKQNIGIYYAIGYGICKLIQNKNKKQAIKQILFSGIITIGLIAIYCIYLWSNQNLYNFINYAFLGISEFGTKNYAFNSSIYQIALAILSYPIMIWIISSKKLKFDKMHKEKAIILICFAAVSLLMAYPLMNEVHIREAIILTLISFVFVIEKAFLEELTANTIIEKAMGVINVLFIIVIIGFCIWENSNYYISMKDYDYYDIYYGSVVTDEMKQDIDEIVNYINENESEGKKVIVLSYYADLYMNVLGKNNGKMDLPFYGNLGKEGENGLIQEITELQNTNLLILKEEDTVFQESKKVREHIMNNYEQIGEIGRFLIYKVGY